MELIGIVAIVFTIAALCYAYVGFWPTTLGGLALIVLLAVGMIYFPPKPRDPI